MYNWPEKKQYIACKRISLVDTLWNVLLTLLVLIMVLEKLEHLLRMCIYDITLRISRTLFECTDLKKRIISVTHIYHTVVFFEILSILYCGTDSRVWVFNREENEGMEKLAKHTLILWMKTCILSDNYPTRAVVNENVKL